MTDHLHPALSDYDPNTRERKFTPADVAAMHRRRTGHGAVVLASAETGVTPEDKKEVPLIWDPNAERIPENFARAGQVFKDEETGKWYRWDAQTTTFTTNRLKLPEGETTYPLTYCGHYSHGFNQNGQEGSEDIAFTGGGWGHAISLREHGWQRHGRTFTRDEIDWPFSHMSREQMICPVLLSDEEVAELEEKLPQLEK